MIFEINNTFNLLFVYFAKIHQKVTETVIWDRL